MGTIWKIARILIGIITIAVILGFLGFSWNDANSFVQNGGKFFFEFLRILKENMQLMM